jgi:segregation and condensation protein A
MTHDNALTEEAALAALTSSSFEEDPPHDGTEVHAADAFLLNIDGYEGPIDILLGMARDQKVDLAKISILQLARQYLQFIERAHALELDLAAEYLVMAAWLAYLKSRLLLPRDKDEEGPDAQAMAEALQFQLRRLEAMKQAAENIIKLPQLGQGIYRRGMPEGLRTTYNSIYDLTLYDLLRSYGDIKRRAQSSQYELPSFKLMSMEAAMERMTAMLGKLPRNGPYSVWTTLDSFLPQKSDDKLYTRSSLASMLTVTLELAKQGKIEVRQDGPFRPVYMRATTQEFDDVTMEDKRVTGT